LTQPGGYIGFNRVPAASALNSAASGIWTLREAEAMRRAGTWPTTGGVSTIAGLQLWLDAADASTLFDATSGGSLVAANGGVARWEDKSGNGRHFSQSDSAKRPQRKTAQQNGLDSLLFDGTNDSLTGSDFLDGDVGGTTVFVVLQRNATGALHGILTKGTTNGGWVFRIANTNKLNGGAWTDGSFANSTDVSSSEAVTATGYTAFAWRHTAGSFHTQQFFRNGISVAVASPLEAGSGARTLPNTSDVMRIGVQRYDGALAAPGDYFLYNGNIAEIIVYDSALSDTDRDAVESYLMSKWAIT
jgi:hypothetical protein